MHSRKLIDPPKIYCCALNFCISRSFSKLYAIRLSILRNLPIQLLKNYNLLGVKQSFCIIGYDIGSQSFAGWTITWKFIWWPFICFDVAYCAILDQAPKMTQRAQNVMEGKYNVITKVVLNLFASMYLGSSHFYFCWYRFKISFVPFFPRHSLDMSV